MGAKYRTEWLVDCRKGKDGNVDLVNERIHTFTTDTTVGLVFKTKDTLPDEVLKPYETQLKSLSDAVGNAEFNKRAKEMARESAFCDFMQKLEAFMDYASDFIDVESVYTKKLTELDKCTDDE